MDPEFLLIKKSVMLSFNWPAQCLDICDIILKKKCKLFLFLFVFLH